MDTLDATSSSDRSFPSSSSPATRQLRGASYVSGILLLLIVVFLWTASNFITQALFQEGYDKPFLLTYLSTSSFALYLLPGLVRQWRNGKTRFGRFSLRDAGYQPVTTGTRLGSGDSDVQEEEDLQPIITEGLHPLTTRETVDLAFTFCFLWFIANWTVNAALLYTSVASATIISSMSGFFTLGIGRLFLVERLTYTKIAAVVASFGGVLLVSLSDSSSKELPVLSVHSFESRSMRIFGDFLALISALFYALYVTLLKVRIRSESRIDMQLFFGFVGLFNILTCWLLGVFLHLIGAEPFELPATRNAVGAILITMFITLTSDYLYVLAMLKTSPLVVTIGLSLTIPLAVIGDFTLGKPAAGQIIVGAFLVLVSFIAVGMDDANTKREEIDRVAGDGLDTRNFETLQDEPDSA
ncbi:hypothetical protein L208DRAFT_1409149 [Tricholoma matsutake]|nr:hypothetical protein L208DRAFT_1409149 [Tricholoma matsutake 945]